MERPIADDGAGDGTVSLRLWLERLRSQLDAVASDANLELARGEQAALLDLTRVAAHSSERIAAPLSAFVLGAAWGKLPSPERERRIRDLTARLEPPRG